MTWDSHFSFLSFPLFLLMPVSQGVLEGSLQSTYYVPGGRDAEGKARGLDKGGQWKRTMK